MSDKIRNYIRQLNTYRWWHACNTIGHIPVYMLSLYNTSECNDILTVLLSHGLVFNRDDELYLNKKNSF